MPRPKVIVHAAVSLDGRIDGLEPDLEVYYGLIGVWDEDVTLCGSETILAAQSEPDPPDAAPLQPSDPDDRRPLLAVIDSRGRVRSWNRLITAGHWRSGLALCWERTPAKHLDYLRAMNLEHEIVGFDRVDLDAALESIARRGAQTVRIDAGPTLNGLALRSGLVDEVSLLVHPVITGEGRPFAEGPDTAVEMRQIGNEARGDLLWLRFAPG